MFDPAAILTPPAHRTLFFQSFDPKKGLVRFIADAELKLFERDLPHQFVADNFAQIAALDCGIALLIG
jgi:hypothetical protein